MKKKSYRIRSRETDGWKTSHDKQMAVIPRRFKLLGQVVSDTITDQINDCQEYYTRKLDITVSSRSFLRG